jgi:diguanylate cyclase (GGDEF)-like protein/PAS domain S-box-containing protein
MGDTNNHVKKDSVKLASRVDVAMMDSESRYRRLFEIAQDGILIMDGNTGEITDVNPFLLKMLGYSSEEFLGKKPWEISSFKDLKATPNAFQELQEKKEIRYQDLPLKTKDGRLVHVEFICNVYLVGDGKVILCNIRDITGQKQVEALQEAVYRIAIATETANSLNDLYQQIHQIISSVMPAENFYITIYNEEHNTLQFPYFKDVLDEPYLGEIEPGKGLTAFVLRTGKSLLCTQAVHDELERQGAVKLLGEPSAIWLGVPLIIEGKTIGAMVVQHYSDPKAYGEREQHMLEFVSSQVAVAISRKQVEEALREGERRLQNAERVANLGSWEMDIATGKSVWSAEFFRICGLEPNAFEPTAEIRHTLTHPDDRARVSQTLRQAIADKSAYSIEERIVRPDGTIVWVDSKGEVLCDESGKPVKIVGSFLDITARKRVEEAQRASEASFRALVEQIPAITYIDKADKSAISLFVSPQIESILGVSQEEWMQGDIGFWASMIHPDDRDHVLNAYLHTIDTGQPFGEEYRIFARDGRQVWIDDHAVLLKSIDNQAVSLHGVMFDITERKRADETLRQLSIHDKLTGLYNRGFFEEEMRRLERGREFPVSIVMADVDHLKETNDTEGHAAGDALLKRVARALTSAFRIEDLVARIGGDEFAILLPNTDIKAAEDALLRIQQILEEHNATQLENPLQLSFGASTAEKPTSLVDVLKEADGRMYAEKQKHDDLRKNQWQKKS